MTNPESTPNFRLICLVFDASGVEVDLIVDRPGQTTLWIEIKSGDQVSEDKLKPLLQLAKEQPDSELLCLSNDPHRKRFDRVTVYPWKEGLSYIFNIEP